MTRRPLKFGLFLAPFHSPSGNPTEQIHRDLALIQHLEDLGYHEAWIGEHHSAAFETIGSPELFIAHAAAITKQIRLGTGVVSLAYHNPLMLADRILQLDHQTRGRVMFGCGPGQLPSDAFMMGIRPVNQRRMMNESLDVLVPLLRGETVTRKTDWFDLQEARCQLPPVQWPQPEMTVASALSPSGSRAAGKYGLGLLSLAASGPEGYDKLPQHWEVCEEKAAEHGQSVDRANWRCVLPMHIAETREQAYEDMRHGTMELSGYMGGLLGRTPSYATSFERMLEEWTGPGLPVFGKLTLGNPDDAIAVIEKLLAKSGGFGTVLLFGHNCASPTATLKSYELIAQKVIPAINDMNRGRVESLEWAGRNSKRFIHEMMNGVETAIEEHEKERAHGGASKTEWKKLQFDLENL